MLAQHGRPVGLARRPMLGSLLDIVLHILDDSWMGLEHDKGDVGLEKGRLALIKSKKHFRGVLFITYKELSSTLVLSKN